MSGIPCSLFCYYGGAGPLYKWNTRRTEDDDTLSPFYLSSHDVPSLMAWGLEWCPATCSHVCGYFPEVLQIRCKTVRSPHDVLLPDDITTSCSAWPEMRVCALYRTYYRATHLHPPGSPFEYMQKLADKTSTNGPGIEDRWMRRNFNI